jgi:hypothetical protein
MVGGLGRAVGGGGECLDQSRSEQRERSAVRVGRVGDAGHEPGQRMVALRGVDPGAQPVGVGGVHGGGGEVLVLHLAVRRGHPEVELPQQRRVGQELLFVPLGDLSHALGPPTFHLRAPERFTQRAGGLDGQCHTLEGPP